MGDSGPSSGQGSSAASACHWIQPSPATQSNSLFSDPSPGEPLHFHIHSAIPTKLKADLVRLIEASTSLPPPRGPLTPLPSQAHGGKVHKRLIDLHHPFYALVHPGSPKLAEYTAYVSTREPPTERGTVVPYSFVRSSIAARHILRPADFLPEPGASHADSTSARAWAPLVLTRGSPRQAPGSSEGAHARSTADQPEDYTDGWGGLEPVTVHLHVTLAQDERTSLAVKIAPRPAFSMHRSALHKFLPRAQTEINLPLDEHSLNTGHYFHDPLQKAPMGGRKPGADRNDFTTEDDTRLAQFIAKRIPNKSEGGRTGNNLYKDLCDRTDIYPWAAGHTWQSWRNRYRKRQAYFDPIIDDYAARRQHNGDGKGEYGYSRGKKRAVREDSPASAPANDREKRLRSSNEPSMHDQNASGPSKSTNDPRRKRLDPRERSSPQERPRTSDTSAQRSNVRTTQLGHATGDTADATLGLGGEIEYAQSAAVARVESNESGGVDVAALDPDPNNNNVSGHAPTPGGELDFPSAHYDYGEFDRDVHDRARDLGLSDYLAQGFTSTW
ncbi:hypothetical protein FRC06_002972 [Ceratobasidium sp. 370]|nr:hypothetical protein FRC06_002972 [Ceratobasidium sp. 370]